MLNIQERITPPPPMVAESLALIKIYLSGSEIHDATEDFIKFTNEVHDRLSGVTPLGGDDFTDMTVMKITHYISANKLTSVRIVDVDLDKGILILTGRY